MSGAAGLRNWRGEIIQPKAAAPGDASDAEDPVDAQRRADTAATAAAATGGRRPVESSPKQKTILRKDEFGRDVEVVVEETNERRKTPKSEREGDRKKDRKHKHKHKQKKHKHRRGNTGSSERFRSPSLQGRLVGTPPPPDPFRPQLDENRGGRLQQRRRDGNQGRGRSRSRSRTRSRSRHRDRSRSRDSRSPRSSGHRRHRHRSSSHSRSKSRGRNRSRSPASSRSRRRRSSASLERKWTHNAFDDRSPSPPRGVDPFYRPEPETWVSRAGGVYLPRK